MPHAAKSVLPVVISDTNLRALPTTSPDHHHTHPFCSFQFNIAMTALSPAARKRASNAPSLIVLVHALKVISLRALKRRSIQIVSLVAKAAAPGRSPCWHNSHFN
jgi:hypothetical protein